MTRGDISQLRLSVIVPSFERPNGLRDTVTDLMRQSHLPDEILVIDQSERSMQAELEAIANGRLRYFWQREPNAQVARNRGIREATGDILLFLDDDVRLPPHLVAAHLANYHDAELAGAVGQVLSVGQSPTHELPDRCRWPHNGWMFLPLNYAVRCKTENFNSCNGSVRREIALKAGGFDENFVRTWWDDSDFAWRLRGQKLIFDPEASLTHLQIPHGGRRPARAHEHVWCDVEYWGTLFYFWRKNFGLWPVWRHVAWWVRAMIFRRGLLWRPHWVVVNFVYLLRGYRWASARLGQPRYLREGTESVHSNG